MNKKYNYITYTTANANSMLKSLLRVYDTVTGVCSVSRSSLKMNCFLYNYLVTLLNTLKTIAQFFWPNCTRDSNILMYFAMHAYMCN